jgi:hypothetical protein
MVIFAVSCWIVKKDLKKVFEALEKTFIPSLTKTTKSILSFLFPNGNACVTYQLFSFFGRDECFSGSGVDFVSDVGGGCTTIDERSLETIPFSLQSVIGGTFCSLPAESVT